MKEIGLGREGFGAVIGLDWADEKHVVYMRDISTCRVETCEVEQKPEALQQWVNGLRKKFAGSKVAIAVEQSRGPLIYALMGYEFIVLYPINPKALAAYRESLRCSGAKDDPSDSELLMSFLEGHWQRLRAWEPEEEISRKLAMLVEFRRKLVGEATRITNRLTALLKGYYPQALELIGDLKTALACDFLKKWPTLQQLKKARRAQLRNFYYAHNCRSSKLIERRIAEIPRAVPLTEDGAIVSASQMMVQTLVEQLRVVIGNIEKFDQEIKKVFAIHPDHQLYGSLPGAGPVLQPRMAAGMGTNRNRYETAAELQQFVGTAPVTRRSGKSRRVHWRTACPKFVRQTHVEFAAQSVPQCLWAAAYYQHRLNRGDSRQKALRALAYKWDRIIFRCWKDRTPYDENKYLEALQRRNSPLLKLLNTKKSNWVSCAEILRSPEFQKNLHSKTN